MEKLNCDLEAALLKLLVPPASQTETSIALIWEKPEASYNIESYQIYVNGEIQGSCQCTDYTVRDLKCSREYEVFIKAFSKYGELLLKSNTVKVSTKSKAEIFDITSYGAVGDGKTLNTKSIQKTIDACSFGGKVYVPKGIFLTGAIFLKSNITLYIEEGGVLLGSDNIVDYPLMRYRFEGLETICYASLINTEEIRTGILENITIAGSGKIDANGSILRKKELEENKGKPGRAICLRNVNNIYLYEITVKQSPAWCVHFIYCQNISVNQIKIYSKQDKDGKRYIGIENGDGLDPDSSKDVFIFHSMIASEDDCIAIKSGKDAQGRRDGIPSENIRITNCSFKSGFGVAVGSEMSGGVRNVLVQDCIYEDVYCVANLKALRGRGGIIENIKFEDITYKNRNLEYEDCKWFRGAINIDQFYSHDTFDVDESEEVNDGTSIIRDIAFKNISLETLAGNAIYLTGLPESPICSIKLTNIHAAGKGGLKANNVRGLELNDVSVEI